MAVTAEDTRVSRSATQPSLFYRPEVRAVVYQVVLVVLLIAFFWMVIHNATINLRRQNVASGFDFLDRTSGFDISQRLIDYSAASTFQDAIIVGLLNTLLVSGIGIVLATVLGFVMGIARLSRNWLIAKIASVYVELARNIPLLLQLFVWYFGVIRNLPPARQAYEIPGGALLSIKGLYLPNPIAGPGFRYVVWSMLLGLVLSAVFAVFARRYQARTGERLPVLWTTLGLVVVLPGLLFIALGQPLTFDYPRLVGFNFRGGLEVLPEIVAMLLGLVFYTGGFIAEIVRAGISGVPKGQKEAASALGLSHGQTLRLVVIPQAMRIIIPPLTSQYLNLTKNSSLGIAIAYPDLTHVLANTTLNQTNQAIECIAILMGIYLTLSLITSLFMNWFNKRMALVER
jgi:general L-amino acid transport system permease protein